MKKTILILATAAITTAAFAQGKVSLQNDASRLFKWTTNTALLFPPEQPFAGLPIDQSSGHLPSGMILIAGLYGGTSSDSLSLLTTAQFGTLEGSPGLINPLVHIILPFPGGTLAWFEVKIWDSAYINYEAALAATGGNDYFGTSPVFTMTPGTGIGYPPIAGGGGSTWPTQPIYVGLVTGPSILSQPQSLSVIVGSNATLSVTASSYQPLTYQWRKGGAPINGATNSAINFVSAALSDAGNYDVVCSNLSATLVSSNAVLQVLPYGAPSIRVNGELAVGTVQVISPTVTLSGGFPGGILFYTLDGSVPTTGSPVYTGPLNLTSNAIVQAMSLSADFVQTSVAPPVTVLVTPVYSLQTTVSGNGTITVTPPNGPYPSNTVVTLTANAPANWAFDHWTGDLSGSNNPATLVMNGPRSVGAVFVPTIYPLTVSSPGGGSVTVDGTTIPPSTFYPSGSVVTLAANSSNGWSFIAWQGTVNDTANPLNLVMNQTNNVQAIFGTVVTTHVGGSGSIIMSQPNPVPFGTALTLTAVPAPGYHFVAWSGAASGTDNPTTLVVTNANPVLGAFFGGPPSLTISLTATNTVMVSWPSPSAGWSLLFNTDLATGGWGVPGETIYDNGTLKYIIVNPWSGNRFYRLQQQ